MSVWNTGIRVIPHGNSGNNTINVGVQDSPGRISFQNVQTSTQVFQVGAVSIPYTIQVGSTRVGSYGNVGILPGPPQGVIFDYGNSTNAGARRQRNRIMTAGGRRRMALPGMNVGGGGGGGQLQNFNQPNPVQQQRPAGGGGNRRPLNINVGGSGHVNKCTPLRASFKE